MNRTILVTGVAGFIGSHTAQAFLGRGDRVVGADNLNDAYDPSRKRANLAEVQSTAGPAFQFVQGDVRDRSFLREVFACQPFDAVVHLAAMAGVGASIHQPHLYYDVNLTGALNLLEEARRCRVGNFILASTSSVYGQTRQIPFVESDPCDRPLSPYAGSKRAAELLAYSYHHLYRLSVTVLRFFTVYGPRGRPDMMACKVADSICSGRAVPLYNGGRLHRDWTYIDDIVQGILAASDCTFGYEVINLGCGQPVLLADFVARIEACAGRKANLVPAPMPESDIPYTYASIEKAERLLGYRPLTSVAEGVGLFWEWQRRVILNQSEAGRISTLSLGEMA
jgi:UDP-glucuronate 4-epimerase